MITLHFLLNNVATFKWRGVGGRTVAKTLQYDLPVVASSAPDIVILQLGTNDLSRLDPLVVASSIACEQAHLYREPAKRGKVWVKRGKVSLHASY